MSGVNKVILIGNLGNKPELKYTNSGIPVAQFSLATTERFGKDDLGNLKQHVEWHRIRAWRKLGEICAQYLDKGSKVYIEGRIRTNKWDDKEGITRYTTEITADNLVMLSSKNQVDGESEPAKSQHDNDDLSLDLQDDSSGHLDSEYL